MPILVANANRQRKVLRLKAAEMEAAHAKTMKKAKAKAKVDAKALELIESLIYKYDVEFLDMVEKSNMPQFKSKIQNFLVERDKGKFDVKLINNLPDKCLESFDLDAEEL